jgi:hypothetical protein
MAIPDRLYKVAEFSRCGACGYQATLYGETESDEDAICPTCWFELGLDIVDETGGDDA